MPGAAWNSNQDEGHGGVEIFYSVGLSICHGVKRGHVGSITRKMRRDSIFEAGMSLGGQSSPPTLKIPTSAQSSPTPTRRKIFKETIFSITKQMTQCFTKKFHEIILCNEKFGVRILFIT